MPTSFYDALDARGLRPTWAEDSISADTAGDEESALLELESGSVVLRHSRRGMVGDKIVNVSRSVYRADRFTLWLQLGNDA